MLWLSQKIGMLPRPCGKMKPKSKIRSECTSSNSNYTTASDDIWMKNWGKFCHVAKSSKNWDKFHHLSEPRKNWGKFCHVA